MAAIVRRLTPGIGDSRMVVSKQGRFVGTPPDEVLSLGTRPEIFTEGSPQRGGVWRSCSIAETEHM